MHQAVNCVFKRLTLCTDSQLLINSATQWMPGWKRRGWKKGDGSPVLNVDLVQALDVLMSKIQAPGLKCGAVCVYPARVNDVAGYFSGLGERVPIASVAGGFPSGQGRRHRDRHVINRAAALDGDWKMVYEEVKRMQKDACGATAHLKTILATGELGTSENVYKASWAAMRQCSRIKYRSHFIRTSTGKESVKATLEVAFVMLTAIAAFHKLTGRRMGFKP
ncbi:Protein F09E5.3 [Aphelenchoides avenae]|nr:Protein F09E5.3 [Aphelenchus avenae]